MSSQVITVAIVEDTPETMERFTTAIAQHTDRICLIKCSGLGSEMVAWLQSHSPDVLLVDLGLPDISGLQVIRQCRKISPSSDIMVISMFGDEQNMLAAFEAGATGYLLKDGGEQELAMHIEHLHAGGSPMSPLIARQLIKRLLPAPKAPEKQAHLNQENEIHAPKLTVREHDILLHLSQGFSYQECATLLNIAVQTVQTHIKNIYRKLEVHSMTEAIFEARQMGILSR
jgi:DNA-binding NarL/FixJ family response regulator